jgi:hypothetical protein
MEVPMHAPHTFATIVAAGCRLACASIVMFAAAPAAAQPAVPPPAHAANLSGPRFGVTVLSEGVTRKLEDYEIDVGSVITQFGWQVEKQFFSRSGGVTAMTEWVFLAGGLEQGVVLPSLNWLVGVRTGHGVEFGVGPNLTPAGTALALAGGVTLRAGVLNLPLNVAVVPSKSGVRVSVLGGFTLRR